MKVSERRIRVKTMDRVICTHCGQVFTREMARHNYGAFFLTRFGRAVANWKRQHRCGSKQVFRHSFFLPTGEINDSCGHYRRPRNVIECPSGQCLNSYSWSKECKPDTCPRMYHEEEKTKASQ